MHEFHVKRLPLCVVPLKTQRFMIKYVTQVKKNPVTKSVAYYPQIAPVTLATLAQIVKRIEKRSTVSSTDVKVVVDALQYEVKDALQNGNSVRLGDLDSFRLSIKANGSETSAEAKRTGPMPSRR